MTLYKKIATTTIIVSNIILMTTSFLTPKKCEKGKDTVVFIALIGVHLGFHKVVSLLWSKLAPTFSFTGRLGNTVTLQFTCLCPFECLS